MSFLGPLPANIQRKTIEFEQKLAQSRLSFLDGVIPVLPPLNGLRAFEVSARVGSFVAAGKTLHISPSAVSRLVKLLEQRLGVSLFRRLPNGLELTRSGMHLFEKTSAALQMMEEAVKQVQKQESHSLLIGAGPTLAMRWLIPRLASFHASNPEIEVRVSTAVQDAHPLLPDWDAAIRAGDGRWPGLRSHFLFDAQLFPVCSPRVARKLRAPEDLKSVSLIGAANAPDDWSLWANMCGSKHLSLRPSITFDFAAFALQAAVDGQGVALANSPFVHDDLAAGRLVRPFAISAAPDRGWYFVYKEREFEEPALTAFRKWLMTMCADQKL